MILEILNNKVVCILNVILLNINLILFPQFIVSQRMLLEECWQMSR